MGGWLLQQECWCQLREAIVNLSQSRDSWEGIYLHMCTLFIHSKCNFNFHVHYNIGTFRQFGVLIGLTRHSGLIDRALDSRAEDREFGSWFSQTNDL